MEIIYHASDAAAVLAEAQRLGFTDASGNLLEAGLIASGGSWFITKPQRVRVPTGGTMTDTFGNPAPAMQELPGVWGRLRMNGDPANLPTFGATITQYRYVAGVGEAPGFWTSDGVTPAPAYVANIGLIA